MNRSVAVPHPLLTSLKEWGKRLLGVLAVVALGWMLGSQYVNPNKRVLALMAGAVVVGIAWRINMISALGLLVFALLYPRGTVFGNTNFALILLLLVMWLMRISFRTIPAPRRTPVDFTIAALLIALIVSFRNVEPQYVSQALQNFMVIVASLLMFYLIANNIHTSQDLARLHVFQIIALTSACLFAIYEVNHPGGVLIPGWIDFSATHGTEFDMQNVRVGGPFGDFELMSEFAAINLLLVLFLFVRAASRSRRIVLGGLAVVTTFVLFTTVTRGAIISLGAGVVYGLWVFRRRLRMVPMVVIAAVGTALFLGMNFYVSNFTRSGDLIERLGETKFYGGVPDSRVVAWQVAWERYLQHPIIGHGPFYSSRTGIRTWYWPHNVYLYILNIVGAVGLLIYLVLLIQLWRISRPDTDDLRHPSYARAFLVVAHIQLIVFVVDQVKIDFLRNIIYQFQPWILFASIVAAHRVVMNEAASRSTARSLPHGV